MPTAADARKRWPSRRAVCGGAAALATGRAAVAQTRPSLRAFPAGAPAALLIWAVRPEALLGWPRPLSSAQLSWLPPAAARLPTLGVLTAGGPAANLEGVAARRPDLLIDYGDLGPDFAALAARARNRLRLPYRLIDGRLASTGGALREAGTLLGADRRGETLAAAAADVLGAWSVRRRAGPSFYYARGPDGLETGLQGSLATEVLEGAGWRNVVGARRDGLARVNLEQVAAWDPEVVVTLDSAFARAAAAAPVWSRRRSGGRRTVVLLPDMPFGWIDRPPSINRLLGCAWATLPAPLAEDPAPALRVVSRLHGLLYGRTPSAVQLRHLAPRILR